MPCCEVFAVDGDGYMRLPAAPGLGVDIDEAKARATIRVHMWSGS
jgi:L-alanine-DL-glutamate epimerase-like enolase superfamily enzyme